MTTLGEVRGDCSRHLIAPSTPLRRGFTYAESMIALAVMSLAGAALLNSVAGAVQSSNDSIYRSVGQGMAEQLMNEIAASKFPTGTAGIVSPIPLRSWFTTIDDYDKFSECPPRTKAGEVLGNDDGAIAAAAYMEMTLGKAGSRTAELAAAPNFVGRFTRSVLIERLQPNPTGWTVVTQHTPHRRVTVFVAYTANKSTRTVAQVVRVFSSVSPAPEGVGDHAQTSSIRNSEFGVWSAEWVHHSALDTPHSVLVIAA